MFPQKPNAVSAASARQYTAAGRELQVTWVVCTSDGRWDKEIDTWISWANTVLCELHRSVVTKRELSNTAKLSVFKSIFVPTADPHPWSWTLVMTERMLSLLLSCSALSVTNVPIPPKGNASGKMNKRLNMFLLRKRLTFTSLDLFSVFRWALHRTGFDFTAKTYSFRMTSTKHPPTIELFTKLQPVVDIPEKSKRWTCVNLHLERVSANCLSKLWILFFFWMQLWLKEWPSDCTATVY